MGWAAGVDVAVVGAVVGATDDEEADAAVDELPVPADVADDEAVVGAEGAVAAVADPAAGAALLLAADVPDAVDA